MSENNTEKIIPNTRERFITPQDAEGNDRGLAENKYYHGYLNPADALWVNGYDMCAAITDNLFNHLDDYEDYLSENMGAKLDNIDESILHSNQYLSEFSDEEINDMTPETRILKCMRDILVDWAETIRDSLIVDRIDNMDPAEYDEIVKGVKDGTYKNLIIAEEETGLSE